MRTVLFEAQDQGIGRRKKSLTNLGWMGMDYKANTNIYLQPKKILVRNKNKFKKL